MFDNTKLDRNPAAEISSYDMTEFGDLPAELIAHIVSYLADNEDVFNVRTVSKQVERSISSYFGRRFFSKRGFMITTPSLQVLQSISKHEGLRGYLRHLWFNPDCFTFNQTFLYKVECSLNPETGDFVMVPDNFDNDPKYDAFQAATQDHKRMIDVETLSRILKKVFRRLPNLDVIGMRRSEDYAPWGWRQLFESVGQDPRVIGPIYDRTHIANSLSGPTALFLAIINAVAATNTKLIRLYTDAIEIDNIRPDLIPQFMLDKACESIWYLEVNCTRARFEESLDANFRNMDDTGMYGQGLAKLLKACSNLKEIGLQIFPDMKQSHMVPPRGDWQRWNESYQYLSLENLVGHVHFDRLTRIKLEKFTTRTDVLLKLLPMSLTSVKLRGVRLISSVDNKQPWKAVFEFLRDSTPDLDYLLLYHLMHEQGGVSFVEHPPETLPPRDTDITGAPNPTFGELAEMDDGEFFTNYEHIALEAKGVEAVNARMSRLVDQHYYHKPIFSYAMDEDLWHTDTSDEE